MNKTRFIEAMTCFNGGDYYACHEILETSCWEPKNPSSANRFVQGLIQLAVACHHRQHHNPVGARRLWLKALHHLESHDPSTPPANWINTSALIRGLKEQLRQDASLAPQHNSPTNPAGLIISCAPD